MIKPQLPGNEAERLTALRRYALLDSPPEPAFDDLVLVASTVCQTQMAAVVLVDEHRQWLKAAHGAARSEAPRDISFCAHAILRPDEVMTVEDTLLDRVSSTTQWSAGEAAVRFYSRRAAGQQRWHAAGFVVRVRPGAGAVAR